MMHFFFFLPLPSSKLPVSFPTAVLSPTAGICIWLSQAPPHSFHILYISSDMRATICIWRHTEGTEADCARGVCQQARVGFWVRGLSVSLSTLCSSSESDAAQSVLKKGTNKISLMQTHLPIPYSLTLCWFRKASVGPNGVCHNNEGSGFCKESHSYGTWQTSQYSTKVSAHIGIMPASSVLISFCFYSACETWLIQAQLTPALVFFFFCS